MKLVIRVLHVVESFDGQAIEQWLIRVYEWFKKNKPDIEMIFYCCVRERGRYDFYVRELGASVFYSPFPISNQFSFISSFREFIFINRIDVVHCHQDVMSGAFVFATLGLPLKRRIVHVHNTAMHIPTKSLIKKLIFRSFLRRICLYGSDRIVGVSNIALRSFLGRDKIVPLRDRVIHCGIELLPVAGGCSRAVIRSDLSIPVDSNILLFVGRMIDYKNPLFVVGILKALLSTHVNSYAVFVGSGPLEDAVHNAALELGVERYIRVLGWRDNVRELMLASDVLVWPSREIPIEGLGLGVVEAQSVGLPVVMSKSVPVDAIVISSIVVQIPLDRGIDSWAHAVAIALKLPRVSVEVASRSISNSCFSLSNSCSELAELYSSGDDSHL